MRSKRIIVFVLCVILSVNFTSVASVEAADELQMKQLMEEDKSNQQNLYHDWQYDGIDISAPSPQKVGTRLRVSASVSGDIDTLQYKFVWQKDNWNEWGVFQEYSAVNEACFVPESAGVYQIYVDIKDESGNVLSKKVEYDIVTGVWSYDSLTTDLATPQARNTNPINIYANTSGDTEHLKYKFVWQKNNWQTWGVIQEFSEASTAAWQPSSVGEYQIFVDVMDADKRVITKIIPYTITEINWERGEGKCIPECRQRAGEPFSIQAKTTGNTKGLSYKFVWQKDNWKSWGIIQEFSFCPKAEFVLKEAGKYQIYIDIKDWDGRISTEVITYEIMTNIWDLDGLVTNLKSPQEKYTLPIEIEARTSGENKELEYKFVWQKNGWKDWGVIKDFSKSNTVDWKPTEVGEYNLYVDVKDEDGKIVTTYIKYIITPVRWEYDSITVMPEGEQKKESETLIQANASGNTAKLQYKFVWMRNNWKEWGLIREFSEDSIVSWKVPKKTGDYKIYVDILDRDGNIKTKTKELEVVSQVWKTNGIDINGGHPEQVYTTIPMFALVEGETEGLEYKYVWEKDNWKQWGVIQPYSKEKNAEWYPKEAGIYNIYADVKDSDGRIKTTVAEYVVDKAAWSMDEIYVEGADAKMEGETFNITAKTSGETKGLQYKFVWEKNNWSSWGVIQEFSDNNSISWTPEETGNYHIYVDIIDQRGIQFDPYIKNVGTYIFKGVKLSNSNVEAKKPVTISPDVQGGAPGAQYKIVWQRNNWEKWGVLQDFSTNERVIWTPDTFADYTIYIDMKVDGYPTITKALDVHVSYPYSGITLDFLLGTSGKRIVEELEAHRYDSYYLGTRYAGLNFSTWATDPCMHPNGAPGKNGYVGMNCAGFVAFVFQKCGADINKVSTAGGRGAYVNASNWFNYVKRSGVEYYGYSSVQALLNSGKAEKGDVIYCHPDWSRPGADCHIGFFWGDTPESNVFWHSGSPNQISNIKSATQVSTYYLIKTRK